MPNIPRDLYALGTDNGCCVSVMGLARNVYYKPKIGVYRYVFTLSVPNPGRSGYGTK